MAQNLEITFNDAEANDLGGAVVIFQNAISFDSGLITSLCETQIANERSQMYVDGIDPETGKKAFINRSGYFYDKEGMDRMPKRGSMLHSTGEAKLREFSCSPVLNSMLQCQLPLCCGLPDMFW